MSDLFDGIDHDGRTYSPVRDRVRLNAQTQRVYDVMIDGVWRTLRDIERMTDDPQASISARLRDLRKQKFGGHTINRVYVTRGLFKYQMIKGEEQ